MEKSTSRPLALLGHFPSPCPAPSRGHPSSSRAMHVCAERVILSEIANRRSIACALPTRLDTRRALRGGGAQVACVFFCFFRTVSGRHAFFFLFIRTVFFFFSSFSIDTFFWRTVFFFCFFFTYFFSGFSVF